MAKFSATQLDVFLAVMLFLAGLGYSVSGLPSSIVVACVIWGVAWGFFSHLFFIWDGTNSCPIDVKLILWGTMTFFLFMVLWKPVKVQYTKEHTVERRGTTPLVQPQPVVRSYVVFDGTMRFGEKKDDKGQLLANQNFQVGDKLFFNYYFKSTGPHPVELVEAAHWLYVERDYEPKTQETMIADFKRRLSKEQQSKVNRKRESYTLMPGESRWATSYAATETKEDRILTQDDLAASRYRSGIRDGSNHIHGQQQNASS